MKINLVGISLLLILGFSSIEVGTAQNVLPPCNCTVDAGKDIEICELGGIVNLKGSVTGNFISYNWLPVPEISQPLNLTTDANVTQNVSFTLTAKCRSNTFVPIVNGNFSSGNVGFTTGYIYDAVPGTFGPGHLTVTNNPPSFNSGFGNCGDHTSGAGNMLLVDGSDIANTDVWCENVTVLPNTDYVFEFWATSVYPVSPPSLIAICNGVVIGAVTLEPNMCQWQKVSFCFTPVASGNVSMCIAEASGVGFGNDFAIDDISLEELCRYQDVVNVKLNPNKANTVYASICEGQTYTLAGQNFSNEGSYDIPLKTSKGCDSIITLELKIPEVNVEIDPPNLLGCGGTTILLNGDQSSYGAEYSYLWSTKDGNMVSDPSLWEVLVNKPGTYTLTISYGDGTINCSKALSVLVEQDTTKPIINAGMDGKVSCADTLLTLNGSVVSPNDFNVNWTTTNGVFASKTDTLHPDIKAPGTYVMHVTGILNLCENTDTIVISSDASLPKAIITGNKVLTCKDSTIWLDGSHSDQGKDFTFQWSAKPGKIISNPDSLLVEVSDSGLYELLITNLVSGCKTVASIVVSSDFKKPLIEAGLPDTLSCNLNSVMLNGISNLPSSSSTIQWTSLKGSFISGQNTLNPVINASGEYILQITNDLNGCSQMDTLIVASDDKKPKAIVNEPDTINCYHLTILLDGQNSSLGLDYTYQWSLISGSLTGPTDQNTIDCYQPGSYVFSVTNQLNGCVTNDTVKVIKDIIIPNVSAGILDTLNCKNAFLNLNGGNSSTGPIFSYNWTTQKGNIISGTTSLMPKIDQAGTYYLTVLNLQNGCSNLDSVEIKQDTLTPSVILTKDTSISCATPSIKLDAVNNDKTGKFTYLWTTTNGNITSAATNLNPTINKAGQYQLLVTNVQNACTAQYDVNVISNGEIPDISAGKDTSLNCINTLIKLKASSTYSGGQISISWMSNGPLIVSGANSLSPKIDKAGTYTVTISDPATGCFNSDEVIVVYDTISPKTSIAKPADLTCKILSSIISAFDNNPDWTYSWSSFDGNIISGADAYAANADKAGKYDLIVMDTKNGCSSAISIILNEDKVPPVISAGVDKELTCNQKEVVLEGKVLFPPTNYTNNWYYNSVMLAVNQTLQPTVSNSGVYVLKVENDSNGCAITDTVLVIENTNVPQNIDLQLVPPGCTNIGSAAVIDVTGGVAPFTYSLNGAIFQANPDFNQLSPGNYVLQVMGNNGCIYVHSFELPKAIPLTVTLPDLVTIEYGEEGKLIPVPSVPIDQIASVKWSPSDGLSCDDCLYPFVHSLESKIYKIVITDLEGCTASDLVRVLSIKNFELYIPNVFSPDADGINDVWFLYGDVTKITNIKELKIFDRWGELLFEEANFPINDPKYGWNGKSRDKYLNPGVFVYYFIAEYADGNSEIYKGDITISR